eukprot:3092460-Amphidinium_carterae.1
MHRIPREHYHERLCNSHIVTLLARSDAVVTSMGAPHTGGVATVDCAKRPKKHEQSCRKACNPPARESLAYQPTSPLLDLPLIPLTLALHSESAGSM